MAELKEGAPQVNRKEILDKDLRHVWHPLAQHKALEKNPPMVVVKASGSTIVEASGRQYIDAMAGLWCVNVGYGRQEIVQATFEQMQFLSYYPHTHANVPAARFSEELTSLFHEDLKHVYFVNSGSEANEAALKFARQYDKQEFPGQNRYKIIGRYYAYHGVTMATLAAGGMADRKVKFEPLTDGFLHVPPPYCYRCPLGKTYPGCDLSCARQLEFAIQAEGEDSVAAVIVEPIMSGVGVVVPPDEYLPMVEDICHRHGLLLLVDEVINGFGRTGKWFAHQWTGIKPDIVSIAKGITSAYLPLAATVASDKVFKSFLGEPNEMRHAVQVNTYGGHPASCAAGLANLNIMRREDLPARALETGKYFIEALRENLGDLPVVGDIRGRGLLLGIELVKDKDSKAPLDGGTMQAVVAKAFEAGVIIGRSAYTGRGLGNSITLSPPLVITQEEVDVVVKTIGDAIRAVAMK